MQFIDVQAQYGVYQESVDRAIKKVLDHGAFVLGPEVRELEAALAQRTGAKEVITVGSGTDALLISLMALGIGPGDQVITTPYSWISTAEVIEMVGADTVFIDIDPKTYLIDITKIEAAITDKTKAIIPVSLFGQMPDMKALNAIAEKKGIAVIEDAAQSFGAVADGMQSAHASKIGCTSFFPTKPLSCFGEGGAIFTDDEELAARFRAIRIHGNRDGEHKYVGLNGRMETMQCAITLAKLDGFDEEIKLRNDVAKRYADGLANIVEIPFVRERATHVYAQYTIRCERRDELRAFLTERKIPTAIYYTKSMHEQPMFARLNYQRNDFPKCIEAGLEVLSLPMYPWFPESDQDEVITAISEFYGK